jgi:uncharacterized membrane protein
MNCAEPGSGGNWVKLACPARLAQSLERLPDWLEVATKQSVFAQAKWFGVVKVVRDANEEFIEVTSSLGGPEFACPASMVFPLFA